MLPTLAWRRGALRILDQTRLPEAAVFLDCGTPEAVWKAIRRLAVRGAPAIGCAAAYGVVLGLPAAKKAGTPLLEAAARRTADYLATARPTAVNLFWALERMRRRAAELAAPGTVESLRRTASARRTARVEAAAAFRRGLLAEAHAIARDDLAMSAAIGRHGLSIIRPRATAPGGATRPIGVLTHCNAGALATAGGGCGLAPVYAAAAAGRRLRVYADETRPLCQGARLTAWELVKARIPVTVLCDSMAAVLMRDGLVDLVLVGADRVAANGDTANKIGTYGLAALAKAHDLPFYVAMPSSTWDPSLPDGSRIPIEQRDGEEIRSGLGRRIVPDGAETFNPAFDVTPAAWITAFITERGVVRRPTPASLKKHFRGEKP